MFQFVESIKLENREFARIEYHNQRLNRTLSAHYPTHQLRIQDLVEVPAELTKEVYKCRIVYSDHIEKVEFQAYTARRVSCLKIVVCDAIDYTFKTTNRQELENLANQKGDCDDILIIKNGLVTDTSYSNIVFFDGKEWFTPEQPLLKGTQREYLLDQKIIRTKKIKAEDIANFECAKPINAMLDFELTEIIPIQNIRS